MLPSRKNCAILSASLLVLGSACFVADAQWTDPGSRARPRINAIGEPGCMATGGAGVTGGKSFPPCDLVQGPPRPFPASRVYTVPYNPFDARGPVYAQRIDFWITTTGSDYNDGSSKAKAFASLQRCADYVQQTFTWGRVFPVCKIAKGTYPADSQNLTMSGSPMGAQNQGAQPLVVQGDSADCANPNDVLISSTNAVTFSILNFAAVSIQCIDIRHTTPSHSIFYATQYAAIEVYGVNLGSTGIHFNATSHGKILIDGPIRVATTASWSVPSCSIGSDGEAGHAGIPGSTSYHVYSDEQSIIKFVANSGITLGASNRTIFATNPMQFCSFFVLSQFLSTVTYPCNVAGAVPPAPCNVTASWNFENPTFLVNTPRCYVPYNAVLNTSNVAGNNLKFMKYSGGPNNGLDTACTGTQGGFIY